MEYTSNAKMMLGYIDDDDDEILDYDGQLDLSEDNELDEDEAESLQDECNQQYPETPEEKINWQEQIRMIHLRSHLNQLLEKVKDAQYVTDKAREELKKCRGQIQQFEAERDRLFSDIQNKESEGNRSAVHRVRAAYERVCQELNAEQKLEKMLIERLDHAEYDLAIAEVERGKFILAEDDLLHREHQLSKEKTDMAMIRLHKEEQLARQAMIAKNKDNRAQRDAMKEAERRHQKALEEAERSHERANRYLNKTLEKLKARKHEEEERYRTGMDKKMDMLLKLKTDITHNRDNLKAVRARDKAAENAKVKEEMEERQQILNKGGNPEEILLVKKRQNEYVQNKLQFELKQKAKKADIMQKILIEEENMERRKQRQPYLWNSPSNEKKMRLGPLKQKPLKAVEDYLCNMANERLNIKEVEDNKDQAIMKKCEAVEKDTDIDDINLKVSSESVYSSPEYRRILRKLSAEMQDLTYVSKTQLSTDLKSNDSKKKIINKIEKNKSRHKEFAGSDHDMSNNNTPKNNPEIKLNEFDEREAEDDEGGDEEEGGIEDQDQNDEKGEKEEELLDQAEEEQAHLEEHDKDPVELYSMSREFSESSSDENEEEQLDLAKPEFDGLWNVKSTPYQIPKDSDTASLKPIGGSKMDKEIMKKTMEKTREGIVVQQIAAGREFIGCPFYSKPDIIHFKDFIIGKTYKKKVLLTNVSYTVNYIKFMDITEHLKDFIKIKFDPPGQMSAGLTCEMIVTFKPMINEDLKGEVNFLTQTGPLQIPLICSTKKCDEVLSPADRPYVAEALPKGELVQLCLDTDVVDFSTAVIGETLRRTFTLTNRGALSTKFDFFKVTGMKQRTLTTAVTSLGRMEISSSTINDDTKPSSKENEIFEELIDSEIAVKTTDSSRAVSPDSAEVGEKAKPAGTSSLAVTSKKKSEEELEKIPEAGELSAPLDGEPAVAPDASEATEGNTVEPPAEPSELKQDRESEQAVSPDLAVSEMDDYSSLDGMRVGPPITGEIGPFSSIRLEIIWQPNIPGKVDSEFLVSFSNPLSDTLSIHALANAIDVPVWVERQTVDLKICMFDRLYQDTIIINNRATTALRLKFEVCKELSNHLELLPKTGYIQAQSQFSAQLKFLPRQSLFMEASKYFDPETGVLEAPMTIRVADQTTPVTFTIQAVVTNSEMEFDITDIDFGYCTIRESVKKTIKLTNKSILPQQFGFVGLPEYMEVQPDDGFGTLLPLETLELDVIFSPKKTKEYKLDLVCRSLINKDFKISCKGIGVLTPLELSHQVIHFAATPLYDIASTTFHVVNNHSSSNEFTHPVPRIGQGEIAPVGPTSFEFKVPSNVPFSISPCVGTVMPQQKIQIQVRFSPGLNDEDIRQEALRINTKMEAAREEKEREEAALKEKQEKEQNVLLESQASEKTSNKKKNRGPNANKNHSQQSNANINHCSGKEDWIGEKKSKYGIDISLVDSCSYDQSSDESLQKIWHSKRVRFIYAKQHPNDEPLLQNERVNSHNNIPRMKMRLSQEQLNKNYSHLDKNSNNNDEDKDKKENEAENVDEKEVYTLSQTETDNLNETKARNFNELDLENDDFISVTSTDSENEDEGSIVAAAGKGKSKNSPKGGAPQPKGSKLSAVPSTHSSAVTMTTSPRFDPEALTRDSPEYQAAVTSLVRQFKGQFHSFTVPCYVASGATGNPGELSYSVHNTLYLEVHCPVVKPPIVVISDGGKRTVEFGDVSIGQTYPKSVTIQNISNGNVELTATALNPSGPFVMLNALRALEPGSTHTILLTFSPAQGQMFQEELGIKTMNSTLHLTFKGRGVSPLVNLSIEDNLFDLSAVLVGEFVEKSFKIENTSSLAIDYVIKQDSLSQLRHKKAQELPSFLNRNETVNYVGAQNDSGKNVFDIVPTKGTIQAGEAKEILVTFAPDHESDLYSDGVRIELFDQEESHFFQLIGQAKPRIMFLDGTDLLLPGVESLAMHHIPIEEDDPGDGKGVVTSPPVLVTVQSVMKDDSFLPGVKEIYAGCVRTMAVSQKKPGKTNGEFSLDGIQGLIQKGFTIEPQKGMVEAGTKKPITFTWTPLQGYDPSGSIEETATLTLRCDVTEQITLMIRAMVVTE